MGLKNNEMIIALTHDEAKTAFVGFFINLFVN